MLATWAKQRQSFGPHLTGTSPPFRVAVLEEICPHSPTCPIKECHSLFGSEECPKQRVIFPEELLSFVPEIAMGP